MSLVHGLLNGGVKLPVTERNLEAARQFVWRKWRERAAEMGRPAPKDLTGACKFSSLFAQKVFGGRLRGNKDHQYVLHPEYGVIDLTDAAGVERVDPYKHDSRFWLNPEHRASLESCTPRVEQWYAEWQARRQVK